MHPLSLWYLLYIVIHCNVIKGPLLLWITMQIWRPHIFCLLNMKDFIFQNHSVDRKCHLQCINKQEMDKFWIIWHLKIHIAPAYFRYHMAASSALARNSRPQLSQCREKITQSPISPHSIDFQHLKSTYMAGIFSTKKSFFLKGLFGQKLILDLLARLMRVWFPKNTF